MRSQTDDLVFYVVPDLFDARMNKRVFSRVIVKMLELVTKT